MEDDLKIWIVTFEFLEKISSVALLSPTCFPVSKPSVYSVQQLVVSVGGVDVWTMDYPIQPLLVFSLLYF